MGGSTGDDNISERSKPHGIPTIYRGVQYRSRLEAKWAAMFDLLGWEHQYEPFDLDGWIPDFLIAGRQSPILVEIKPVVSLPNDVVAEIGGQASDHEMMILGCSLVRDRSRPDFDTCPPFLGWLRANDIDVPAELGWVPAGTVTDPAGGPAALLPSRGLVWAIDRIRGGLWQDNQRSSDALPWCWDSLAVRWARAANAVQWRGVQSEAQS